MTTNFIETYYPTTSYILDPRDPYNTIYSYFDASGNTYIFPNQFNNDISGYAICPGLTSNCSFLEKEVNNNISDLSTDYQNVCGCLYNNLNDALSVCTSGTYGYIYDSGLTIPDENDGVYYYDMGLPPCLGVLSTSIGIGTNSIPVYIPFSMNPILNTISNTAYTEEDTPIGLYPTVSSPTGYYEISNTTPTTIYLNNNNPLNSQIVVANYNTWLQNNLVSYESIPISLPPCVTSNNCNCNSSPCNPTMNNYITDASYNNLGEYLAPLYYCPSGNTPYGMNTEPTWALTASGWIIDSSANPILSSSYGCSP